MNSNGNDSVYRIEYRNEVTGGVSHRGPYNTAEHADACMREQATFVRPFVTLQVCVGKGERLVGEQIRGRFAP